MSQPPRQEKMDEGRLPCLSNSERKVQGQGRGKKSLRRRHNSEGGKGKGGGTSSLSNTYEKRDIYEQKKRSAYLFSELQHSRRWEQVQEGNAAEKYYARPARGKARAVLKGAA